MANRYFAVKGINEDSFGYDFVEYKWKGAIQESRPQIARERNSGSHPTDGRRMV